MNQVLTICAIVLMLSCPAVAQQKSDTDLYDDTKSEVVSAQQENNNHGYISAKQAIKSEQEHKKTLESLGYEYTPPQKGNPNYVERTFTMPESEALENCIYATGYSYPSVCFDSKQKEIFRSDRDSQKVLDKIIKKQGKQGKYNKLPAKKRISSNTDE